MKLDKHWEMCGMYCPYCQERLLRDKHDNKDATHYCSKCDDGLVIVGNSRIRGRIKG